MAGSQHAAKKCRFVRVLGGGVYSKARLLFGIMNGLRKAFARRTRFASRILSSFQWVRKVECLVWRVL